ncbi:hypothetical protein QWJ46_07340 [Rhizobium sp. CBN3]|uniref:hypothetical protein n=1 Tax=Rhizobium sp. CBN3 TaxID=3058045 RepID=UPI0026732E33|nr:hypothetical protein [Rhizobium sp. CBN3]MDO3432496.1 hypothetical protein [Rhizobium sp. CBN3]
MDAEDFIKMIQKYACGTCGELLTGEAKAIGFERALRQFPRPVRRVKQLVPPFGSFSRFEHAATRKMKIGPLQPFRAWRELRSVPLPKRVANAGQTKADPDVPQRIFLCRIFATPAPPAAGR